MNRIGTQGGGVVDGRSSKCTGRCLGLAIRGTGARQPFTESRLSLRESGATFAERKATLAARERLRALVTTAAIGTLRVATTLAEAFSPRPCRVGLPASNSLREIHIGCTACARRYANGEKTPQFHLPRRDLWGMFSQTDIRTPATTHPYACAKWIRFPHDLGFNLMSVPARLKRTYRPPCDGPPPIE
jgi:hypothetical protein